MRRVRPAQVPPPPRTARLYGRARTLAEIRAALDRGAVVTLIGPHGVGKSELALHVLATTEGDEHVFVDLLTARDDDDVLAAIAAALDVRACLQMSAAVREALVSRGGLLVLDRCQHLPGIAELVRALRVERRPPILCTSTAPLGAADERAITVEPLDLVDAIDLFNSRSGREPESSRDQALVRDLVSLCGCVPAAIELCAASGEAPLQLLRELESRVQRDRELTEVITWSLDRLDRVSCTALSRASLIEGPFTLATFEAIVELPSDVASPTVLSTLAERGLVTKSSRSDAPFVIAPTVRRIAESRLGDRERLATLQCHARHFAHHFADDIVTRSRERADLVAAHQVALVDPLLAAEASLLSRALLPVLRRHGALEVARAVEEVSTAPNDPLAEAERLLDRGEIAAAAARFRDAALDPQRKLWALRGLAESLRRKGALDEARVTVERALSLGRDIGDLLTLRGAIALDRGDLRSARADLVEALTILGEGRDERAAAAATTLLAEVQAEEGLDETTTLDSALDLARRAGDLRAMARVELLRAVRAMSEGRLDLARVHVDAVEQYGGSTALRDVIRARGDQRDVESDDPLVRAHLERARARLAAVRGEPIHALVEPTDRLARRTLAPAKCAIARDGSRALDVELAHRPTLKNIVAALLRARIEHPGRAVSTTDLFAAGWPGERIPPGAKGDRARAAIQALRDLGLRGHIVTLSGGWALDPERAYDVR